MRGRAFQTKDWQVQRPWGLDIGMFKKLPGGHEFGGEWVRESLMGDDLREAGKRQIIWGHWFLEGKPLESWSKWYDLYLIGYSLKAEQNQRQRDELWVFQQSRLQMIIAWVRSVAGRRRGRTLYSDPGTFTDSSDVKCESKRRRWFQGLCPE